LTDMKKVFLTLFAAFCVFTTEAQGLKKVYDETVNPIEQIDMADEIYVINVGGYIGESTRREIAYAERTRKKVNYLEAI